MGKVLVYWIEITDHGRCDDPRDHIWHALHRYHSLDLSLIKIKSRKYSIILSTSKCILASQACCHFYDMLVLLLAILCAKSLHCHLHLYCNTLFSFYIIFTFGWLAMAVWLETQQWRVQGSLRRHFLALVCYNWIPFKWEDMNNNKICSIV